jgi:hypothetical protein
MTAKQQTGLKSLYSVFNRNKKSKNRLLTFLRLSMPEMIFRTTKLEGEKVTRRMVSSLFVSKE